MSVRFNASGDGLNRTTDLPDYNAPYTVMGWFRIVGDTAGARVFISLNNNGTSNRDRIDITQSPPVLRAIVEKAAAQTVTTGTTLTVGVWCHIAVVRESVTSCKVYLDGVLDITNTRNVTGRTANVRLNVGYETDSNISPLDGNVAFLKAWSSALTATQVANEVHVRRPAFPEGLYGFWPTFGGSGERARDYSGFGRDWTEVGTLSDEDDPPGIYWGGRSRLTLVPSVSSVDVAPISGELRISGATQLAAYEVSVVPEGTLSLASQSQEAQLTVEIGLSDGALTILAPATPAIVATLDVQIAQSTGVVNITGGLPSVSTEAAADIALQTGSETITGGLLSAFAPEEPGKIAITLVVAEEPFAGSLRIIGGVQTASQEDEIVLFPQSGSIVVSAGMPDAGITFGPAPSVSSLTINGQDIEVLLGTAIPTNVFPANGTWDFELDFTEIEGESRQVDAMDGQISFSGNVVSLVAFRRWQKVPPQTDGWKKIATF